MAIQCPITQDNGAVATYHVIKSITVDASQSPPVGMVTLNCYLDADHASMTALGNLSCSINALVQGAITDAPSIFYAIERYLLTLSDFTGGTQVS